MSLLICDETGPTVRVGHFYSTDGCGDKIVERRTGLLPSVQLHASFTRVYAKNFKDVSGITCFIPET
jgi:hypothetical protein